MAWSTPAARAASPRMAGRCVAKSTAGARRSSRNWSAYGSDVELAAAITPVHRALLTDPQTSGGLLVACAPDTVTEVLSIFLQQGFERASVIGEVIEGLPRVVVG